MTHSSGCIADLVFERARATPSKLALVVPRAHGEEGREEVITYAGLVRRVAQYRAGIARAGLRSGDRVLLLFPVSVEFYALALALMASGITLVLLDGAMGAKRTLAALSAARVKAVVSVRALLKLWPVLPPLWRVKKFSVDSGLAGTRALDALVVDVDETEGEALERAGSLPRRSSDEGMLTFTSGTSGRPKGVDRTRGVLLAQYHALVEAYPHPDSDVYMTCFPALALHNLCCGITTVLPPVDLRQPKTMAPRRVLQSMARWGVTVLSAAPAFAERLAREIIAADTPIHGVRALGVGGAPVSRRLCRMMLESFPSAEALVLYGSTEAEPIGCVAMADVAAASGRGYLVGREAKATELALVSLPTFAEALDVRGIEPYRVRVGQVGEIVVRGPHIPVRYIGNADANRRFKMQCLDGSVWHRTGDLARRDADGRLWLVGRREDSTVPGTPGCYPFELEAAALDIPGVRQAAIATPARADLTQMCLELEAGADATGVCQAVTTALVEQGATRATARVVPAIPVDARHQSKVDRRALLGLLT